MREISPLPRRKRRGEKVPLISLASHAVYDTPLPSPSPALWLLKLDFIFKLDFRFSTMKYDDIHPAPKRGRKKKQNRKLLQLLKLLSLIRTLKLFFYLQHLTERATLWNLRLWKLTIWIWNMDGGTLMPVIRNFKCFKSIYFVRTLKK